MSEIEVYNDKQISKTEEVSYTIEDARMQIKKFDEVYKTDVTQYVEKKGQFSYLSWAYAIKVLMTEYPFATWRKIKHFSDETGWYVETAVKLHPSHEPIHEVYPVFEHTKDGMKGVKTPDVMQINKAYQRCLTKNIAMATGIGLHLYAGEDLPDETRSVAISKDDALWVMKVLVPALVEKEGYNTDVFAELISKLWYGEVDINKVKVAYGAN